MASERLFRLKTLVEELSNRDQKIKNDLVLFEQVFDSFPVPVVFWSVDAEGNFFSKKLSCGDSWKMLEKESTHVSSFYKCAVMQEQFNSHFEKSKVGEPFSFLANSGSTHIWHRVIPRMTNNVITSILGLSWDVTSNHHMLTILKKIQSSSEDKPELSEIHKMATEGVRSSRLDKLLKGEEK